MKAVMLLEYRGQLVFNDAPARGRCGRCELVPAPGCDPGLEGHSREFARGSWAVAQWAGSGKSQVTRKDRASCGLP